MDFESGLEPDMQPNLDEFLLARIAEERRVATDAAGATGRERWDGGHAPVGAGQVGAAEHVAHHDPAHVLTDCTARRRLVMACRDIRPDMAFLGRRPQGLPDFPLTPTDQHQLAALTLGLLALPYAEHHEYRPEWRP